LYNVKQTEDCESKSQACESNQKSPVQSLSAPCVSAECNAIIHSFKLTDFGSFRLQPPTVKVQLPSTWKHGKP